MHGTVERLRVGPLIVLWILAAFAAAGCGSGSSTPALAEAIAEATPPAEFITVTGSATVIVTEGSGASDFDVLSVVKSAPADIRLRPGEFQQISARGFGRFGQTLPGLSFRWEILDPAAGGFAAIAADGASVRFSAGTAGGRFPEAIRLTATQQRGGVEHVVSETVPVEIVDAEQLGQVSAVEALGGEILAARGQLLRLNAVAYDPLGRIVPLARFEWELAEPGVGAIVATNLLDVRGGPGKYDDALTLRGSFGDSRATTRVDLEIVERSVLNEQVRAFILPASVRVEMNKEVEFRVVALDGAGESYNVVAAQWSVEPVEPNGVPGDIDARGRFKAHSTTGVFTDSIRFSGLADGRQIEAVATVSVQSPFDSNLTDAPISPASVVVSPGQRSYFTLSPRDQLGRTVRNATVEWFVADPAVGEIDQDGQFEATGAPGYYKDAVRARAVQTVDDRNAVVEASADVTIVGTLSDLEISPATLVVETGGASFLSATVVDENGVHVPGVLFQWRVLDGDAGTIDNSGFFRAGDKPGEYPGAIEVSASRRILE